LRNADTYRDNAKGLADRLGAIVVAPLFDAKRFPNDAYQLAGIMKQQEVQPSEQWTGNFIAKIADAVRQREGRANMPYYLLGHSAGGQFLSRVSGFVATGAKRIVAANPGSDLFPTRQIPFPYGFGNLPAELSDDAALARYLAQPITLLLGTADLGSENLPQGELAMRQGATRYERGKNCFAMAQELARKKGWAFNWQLIEVPGVGHDSKAMFDHQRSADALFGEKPNPPAKAN
jgi:poly(3-hydroxybutyrate) depolymerase